MVKKSNQVKSNVEFVGRQFINNKRTQILSLQARMMMKIVTKTC